MNSNEFTIRHLANDQTTTDYEVELSKPRKMEQVQSVYPTTIHFSSIYMVRLEDRFGGDVILDYNTERLACSFFDLLGEDSNVPEYMIYPFVRSDFDVIGESIPESFYEDSTFDLRHLMWLIGGRQRATGTSFKVSFAIPCENIVSGVVPNQDYFMVWNPDSDWTLGQLEIIENDGRVEYGLGRHLGYRPNKEQADLIPSAEIIDNRLADLDSEILRLDPIMWGALGGLTNTEDFTDIAI